MLANLIGSVLDVVHAAIVNDAGQADPERKLRYHGQLPDDCCSDNGTLAGWWEPLQPSIDFPIALTFKGKMNGALILAPIHVRFVTCWPAPDVDEAGVRLIDERWDPAAARLALIGETVSAALIRASCSPPPAIATEVVCDGFRFLDARISDMSRSGGCAGVTWRCVAGLAGGATGS